MAEKTRGTAAGKVWFIGAGPGDPELITVKGQKLIASADVIVYAGSLVPREVLSSARPGVPVIDSAPLSLAETHALLRDCAQNGGLAARVHTGEPSIYGAVREQAALLDAEGIPWDVVPGVSSAFATAAAARVSFTVPGGPQTFILTRLSGRTPVPATEALPSLAAHGAAMAVLLSASEPERVQAELLAGGYAPETAIVIGHKVGWPGGEVLHTRLRDLARTAREAGFTRQTVFLVLPGQNLDAEASRSKLYDAAFTHGWREASEAPEPAARMEGDE
ncbi:MAG TPA: precorrin-4 C(11)-methyltransferase [Humidesulfovibrio sp.]|uniref:precorrin-4 C(11)-methyltransferase n=1 Tax=Humidesulfovibrio sp. TaxID=2910988 RepID=UPI002BDF3D90|nr:precorrin-4 C(11)-methyltransferase [Humidesulfovibrio sp.]HWR04695.1 precorrin-4 C(11)-methyltransferase [Humidesulfovibrio sp.]